MKINQEGLDWYSLSRININSFNLESFYQIINHTRLQQIHLEKVPESYRKKLLIMFQKANSQINIQRSEIIHQNNSLMYRKKVIIEEQLKLQGSLSESLAQITVKKQTIAEKIKTIKRLKEKIAQKNKKTNEIQKETIHKQMYYCPFCTMNNFGNRQEFTSHVFGHQASNMNNSSNNNQWKEFLLTLKDKEMQLMQMLLKQKKEADRDDLERIYKNQLNDFMKMESYTERSSIKIQEGQVELESKSSYFYHPNIKKQQMKQQYAQPKWKLQEQEKYFNCPSLSLKEEEQLSNQEEQDGKKVPQKIKSYKKDQIFRQQLDKPSLKSKNTPINANPLYLEKNKKYPLNNQLEYSESFKNQPVSKVYNPNNPSRSSVLQQTIYSEKKNSNHSIYIFNSGKIVDDSNPGDSDYEDYFQPKNVHKKCQVKQQIISVDYERLTKNKPSYYLANPSHQQNTSNQFDSCIIDLSDDSFSRRNQNSLSKDISEINLSDLKLSKLQQLRKNDKLQKLHKNQPLNRFEKASQPRFRQQININPKISFKKIKNEGNILQQFTKEVTRNCSQNNQERLQIKKQASQDSKYYDFENNNRNNGSVLNQFLKQSAKNTSSEKNRQAVDLNQYLLT